tara:strand:- start:40 stop:735 length:696 start_codon:yes stop_codon:yes gene_type:complete
MFKKLIIAAISASFVASAAFADSTNIGVRISSANLAASGTETTDSGSINSGGAKVTNKEKDASFELPSIFVERQIEMDNGMNMVLGLDLVPLTEDVATLGGGNGTDANVSAGNLITAYIQPTFSVSETVSVYGKLGYASGDLEITNITRQAGSASQTGDTQSTDVSADKTLEGPVYGLGVQINKDMGVFSFIRLEATHTDFDEIKHTNSNGKVLTADAEMDLVTLTIGKSF